MKTIPADDALTASTPHEGLGHVPFFSLIMPVYGVERYVMDSIADILCQTFRDFELIAVDDASPDSSASIIAELAEGDPRVTLIRQPHNRGVSEARNAGIDVARGTWLLFPDPDDRYDISMLETLHRHLASAECDVLAFSHVQEYFDASGTFLYSNPLPLSDSRITDAASIGRAALELEKETHLGYVWNKAYRKNIVDLHSIRFETVPFIEDILFNLDYLRHVDALETTAYSPYHYAKRISSNLTNAADARYFETHRRRILALCAMADERSCLDDDARSLLGALYARYILSALERNCHADAGLDMRGRRAWVEDLYADNLFRALIPVAQADESRVLAAFIKLLKAHRTTLVLAAGRAVHAVRKRSTTLYTKERSKR